MTISRVTIEITGAQYELTARDQHGSVVGHFIITPAGNDPPVLWDASVPQALRNAIECAREEDIMAELANQEEATK